MSHDRIKRMASLLELAQTEEEAMLQTFQALQVQLAQAQEQLQSLNHYRQEYAANLARKTDVIFASQIHSTQAFIEKLNQALMAQEQEEQRLEQAIEQAKQAWIEKRMRSQALEKLLQKMQKDQAIFLNKQEQKMLDELSAQTFHRQSHEH